MQTATTACFRLKYGQEKEAQVAKELLRKIGMLLDCKQIAALHLSPCRRTRFHLPTLRIGEIKCSLDRMLLDVDE